MSRVVLWFAIASGLVPAPSSAAQTDTSANVLGYELPGMRDVTVRRGIPYSAPGLTMDVYTPPGAARQRPALIFVHGGLVAREPGPRPTEWPTYRSWGRLAGAAGLVGVVFNHRLTTDENVSEGTNDVLTALHHVRSNAASLGVDPNRLCVAVFSAGGPLASVVMRERMPHVRCLVLFYPFLDLEHMRSRSPFRAAHPAAHVDSLVPRYSPAHLLGVAPDSLPPIFLAMAGQDQIPRLNESIERFIRAAVEHRVQIDFALHRHGVHGFDQRNRDARTAEILESVMSFVRRHVQ